VPDHDSPGLGEVLVGPTGGVSRYAVLGHQVGLARERSAGSELACVEALAERLRDALVRCRRLDLGGSPTTRRPWPGTTSTRPSSTSIASADLTVPRETPCCSTSVSSDATIAPGASVLHLKFVTK
jgi:hypothetical protein